MGEVPWAAQRAAGAIYMQVRVSWVALLVQYCRELKQVASVRVAKTSAKIYQRTLRAGCEKQCC
jgi:hypothetical protein